jgi:hypothetical protein
VGYYTLAMTKMKCSILGQIYTGTDVCVGSRKRKKNQRTSVSEILSLSRSLSLMPECQSARLCVYKCI